MPPPIRPPADPRRSTRGLRRGSRKMTPADRLVDTEGRPRPSSVGAGRQTRERAGPPAAAPRSEGPLSSCSAWGAQPADKPARAVHLGSFWRRRWAMSGGRGARPSPGQIAALGRHRHRLLRPRPRCRARPALAHRRGPGVGRPRGPGKWRGGSRCASPSCRSGGRAHRPIAMARPSGYREAPARSPSRPSPTDVADRKRVAVLGAAVGGRPSWRVLESVPGRLVPRGGRLSGAGLPRGRAARGPEPSVPVPLRRSTGGPDRRPRVDRAPGDAGGAAGGGIAQAGRRRRPAETLDSPSAEISGGDAARVFKW
jgi:hypothetical protein